jgi:hypothetical protein
MRAHGSILAVYQYNFGTIWTACYVGGAVACQGPPPVFRAQ